jgi:hypothetical protein
MIQNIQCYQLITWIARSIPVSARGFYSGIMQGSCYFIFYIVFHDAHISYSAQLDTQVRIKHLNYIPSNSYLWVVQADM